MIDTWIDTEVSSSDLVGSESLVASQVSWCFVFSLYFYRVLECCLDHRFPSRTLRFLDLIGLMFDAG